MAIEIGVFHNGASDLPVKHVQYNGDTVAVNDGDLPATHTSAQRTIVNQVRQGILADQLVWEHVSRLLHSIDPAAHELELPDGRQVLVHSEALRDGGEEIGAIVEIRDAPPTEPGVVVGGRIRPPALPGLAGADPAWLRACHEVVAGLCEQIVVVCGEPGVGKTAVAAHAHLGGTGPLVVHDAASMTVDGPSCWLDELRSELAGGPGTVVVRHVDGLSPAALRAVTVMPRGRAGGGAR